MSSRLRFVVTVVLLGVTAIFLQARSGQEVMAPRQPLNSFPSKLGDWTGTDVPIPDDQLAILGPGDFLLRVYQQEAVRGPYVDLYIAYFPSQRAGDTVHSPKNCLPGSGWFPMESSRITLSLPGHEPFPANRYVIAKGDSRQLVFYWYWAHNRAVANEYWAKFYLVADSMRMNRSDGALIRVTTPMMNGESPDAAQQRLISFTGNVVPVINNFVPR